MAWTRIDGLFLKNPKIQRAGVYGMALYVSGLIHCNNSMTDGFIDEALLPGLCGDAFQTPGKKIAQKLVEVGLWLEVDGGYIVNDFLDFNRSKDQIEIINQKRAKAGAKGGSTKAANAKQDAKQSASKVLANSKQDAKQNSTPNNLITLLPNIPKEKESLITSSSSVKEGKKEKNDDDISRIFSAFETELRAIMTPSIRDEILVMLDDGIPADWFVEAFKLSAEQSKHFWAYPKKILNNWQTDGFKSDSRKVQSERKKRDNTNSGNDIEAFRKLVREQQEQRKELV